MGLRRQAPRGVRRRGARRAALLLDRRGPQIWSVGLNDDGSFADDARLEIDVTDTPNGNVITGIVFDGAGALYLAQRGEIVGSYDYSVFAKPEASDVLRYVWDEKEERWSEKPDEFAIGLKDPHRSTEGGVALNYGYDPDGNVDYDQCRATLWTTGEHLREAEGDRVYEGGARIIHGLQGNDKGAVRPANVPPYDSWFVDNDGLYLDADAYGHVGDIAIFNPCDKRSVAEPEPLPFPEEYGEEPSFPPYPPDEEPDLSEPGIDIDKECYPGIFGGELHCEITVTNVGETPSDPIDLYDAATLISGPGRGRRGDRHRRDPRRSRLVLFADPDPGSVVQPAGRRARPGRNPLDRGVPRYRPAVCRRQFRLPQLCRARCALARHRLRRGRHRHHGDQDRAGGVRARRRLHLHRDHHQYRRLPVQRPRAVFRQHARRLAVPRAV